MFNLQDRKLISTAEQMLNESKTKIEVIRMQILQLRNQAQSPSARPGVDNTAPSGIYSMLIFFKVIVLKECYQAVA